MFSRCRRRYWFDYYGARGGWRRSASEETRALYLLKRLQTRPQWLGIVVHELAEHALQRAVAGETVDFDVLRSDALRAARRQVVDARAGRYRLAPKDCVGFVELEYEGDAGDASWEETLDDLDAQAAALGEHPLMRRLLDVPSRILEVEQLRRAYIGGVPVWVSLDVLVRDGRGGAVIIDWKTGHHHADEIVGRQLAIYGAYVHRRYRIPLARIKGLHGSTRTGDFRAHPLDVAVLDETKTLIRHSAEQMVQTLPDPTKDKADKDDFPMVSEDEGECGRCRYRRVCRRE